jgi:hypothetical protein
MSCNFVLADPGDWEREISNDDVETLTRACYELLLIYKCLKTQYNPRYEHCKKCPQANLANTKSLYIQDQFQKVKTVTSEVDIVVSGIKPYENEPLASSSDEDDDSQLDEDGLSPAVLCARFNGEMALDQWYVYF